MKTFLEHLAESEKTYEFRIKIANFDPSDAMDRLESILDAYGLEDISSPKSLPVTEDNINFPSLGPVEVYQIDAILKYPVTDAQLRTMVSERWGVPAASIVVVPRNHPEELWRNNEGELHVYQPGESVLDKAYEEVDSTAGESYQNADVIHRESKKVESVTETDQTEKPSGNTTNDLEQGITSPVGSKQNTIPEPNKG